MRTGCKVLRRIFGPKREPQQETVEDCIRKMKSSMRWILYETSLGEIRNAYKIFVGKPEGKAT
jgi:hypothetical protein